MGVVRMAETVSEKEAAMWRAIKSFRRSLGKGPEVGKNSAQVPLNVVRGHGASKGRKGKKSHAEMPGDQSGQAV